MKKLMILQIKGNDLGGVWFFNKTLGEELLKHDFQVEIVSIRDNLKTDVKLEHDKNLKLKTINQELEWEITRKIDILKTIKKLNFKQILKVTKLYLKEHYLLKKDFLQLKDYIKVNKPDYIIASHYQTLDGIPKTFLRKTIAIQHSSFKEVLTLFDNKRKLQKYSKKIYKMVWLSKKTAEMANSHGFSNNTYMYNPTRFQTLKKANVVENKKLVAITRIENSQKRIDLMLEIVDNVLKYSNWTFELYGTGEFTEFGKNILENNPKMKYMGKTDNPKDILLTSSINLNTSSMEGFSLTILESNMCGVPTIAFDFGESVSEEIIQDKTGYIIYNDKKREYEEKLLFLMNNPKKLQELATNAKEFSQNFTIQKVTCNWLALFSEMDRNLEKRKG